MDEVTVKHFNEVRYLSNEMVWKFNNGLVKLVCNNCRCEVVDQKHMDDSRRELKRQVICSNAKCATVDYRYE